ncbi:MAG: cytochrome c [Pseudomonadota bacterium]
MDRSKLIAAALAALILPSAAGATVLMPEDGTVTARGQAVYKEHCASCHGANLEGEPNWRQRKESGRLPAPPHDEKGHTWHHADHLLFELTKFGLKKFAGENYESDMPAYDGTLSDAEIIAVLSYIKSTWPADIREYHDRLNNQHSD